MPVELSILIPTLNRPHELRLCLEGLAAQTAPLDLFEVVIVDDGSEPDMGAVAADFRGRLAIRLERRAHAGLAAARNYGIRTAQAPLLVLYDDDIRPDAGLVDYCFGFHRAHRENEDCALLGFVPGPDMRSPFSHWAFRRIYGFPETTGWHGGEFFWGGAVTCKRELFANQSFNPEYLSAEDAEFAGRSAGRLPLRVYYDGRPLGHLTREITVEQIRRREYLRGYFQYRLTQDHPHHWRFDYQPYLDPEAYVLRDRGRLRALAAAAAAMDRSLTECGSAAPPPVLTTMWETIAQHATATGWIAAREGRPPEEL
jgi:glycosyltransferase involved in cell wall biosynthesis